MDEREADALWATFEAAQKRMVEKGITNPDELSWGDTLLNVAAALIMVHPLMPMKDREKTAKAMSTLFHKDTVLELVRLSQILDATEGFESKSTVYKNESPDGSLPSDEDIMSSDDLRNLFDR